MAGHTEAPRESQGGHSWRPTGCFQGGLTPPAPALQTNQEADEEPKGKLPKASDL